MAITTVLGVGLSLAFILGAGGLFLAAAFKLNSEFDKQDEEELKKINEGK